MGLFGGIVIQACSSRLIGLFSGTACALLCLLAIPMHGAWTGFALTGLISFVGALSGPNVTATLAHLLGVNRAAGMARYQSISIAVAIGSPLMGALVISAGETKWALMLASLLHFVALFPWLLSIEPCQKARQRTSRFRDDAMRGYLCILRIRPLKLMTLSRVLNNILYIGLPVSLPLVIGALQLGAADAAWAQASGISALRLASLCSGTVLMFLLARYPAIARYLPLQTLVWGLAAVVLLCAADTPFVIVAACAVGGLGQFAFRLSGTTFGPAVTPTSDLAHVILAGDTLVRLFSAVYGVGLVTLAAAVGQPAITLLILGAFAIPAPTLMRPAVDKYFELLPKEHLDVGEPIEVGQSSNCSRSACSTSERLERT